MIGHDHHAFRRAVILIPSCERPHRFSLDGRLNVAVDLRAIYSDRQISNDKSRCVYQSSA